MKKILASVLALFNLSSPLALAEERTAEALLHQMNETSQHLSYELSCVLIKKNSIESLLYRYALNNNQQLAHLVYLSDRSQEVIRRDSEVIYIEPCVESFTIESGNIVEHTILPLNSDVKELSQFYNLTQVSRAREVGVACQVLRVASKDGLRHSYILWVDEKSKLLLRADLVDRDGEVLEQYRTISYSVNDNTSEISDALNTVKLPVVLFLPKGSLEDSFCTAGWIPNGFEFTALSLIAIGSTERMMETQMFSDGLFSFSVCVSQSDDYSLKGKFVRQGRRTLHSHVKGGKEISVVGDIPPAIAKRITQSVTIKKSMDTTQ